MDEPLPLHGDWLALCQVLWLHGTLSRAEVKTMLGWSNRKFKTVSRFMKFNKLIDVKDGSVWLTEQGVAEFLYHGAD